MPIFEFLCPQCQQITERTLPITNTEKTIICPHCDDGHLHFALAQKIISKTSFILKGTGWSNQYKPNTSAGSEDEKSPSPVPFEG